MTRVVGRSRVLSLLSLSWRPTLSRRYPEMYMMRSGSPFSPTADPRVLESRGGERVRLLGAIREVWGELHHMPQYAATRVGVASRCDVPSWAKALLKTYTVDDDATTMWDVAEGGHLVEIYKGSKRRHFEALRDKTDLPFDSMLFFDDDPSNIYDVSRLGVTCILTPDGVTRDAFQEGLTKFAAAASTDRA